MCLSEFFRHFLQERIKDKERFKKKGERYEIDKERFKKKGERYEIDKERFKKKGER